MLYVKKCSYKSNEKIISGRLQDATAHKTGMSGEFRWCAKVERIWTATGCVELIQEIFPG
jgi:hypothetical protein